METFLIKRAKLTQLSVEMQIWAQFYYSKILLEFLFRVGANGILQNVSNHLPDYTVS